MRTMVNPVTAMKVLNERKKFMKKHPDFFAYFVGVFGSGVEEGTEIELSIQRPGEEKTSSKIRVADSDLKIFEGLKELIN